MTSLDLLFWITSGVLLQLALYGCIVFWRHWQAYRALRNVAAEFDIAVNAEPEPELMPTASAAWAGYRTFHVERKVVEDASAQVCSFTWCLKTRNPCQRFCRGSF